MRGIHQFQAKRWKEAAADIYVSHIYIYIELKSFRISLISLAMKKMWNSQITIPSFVK